MIELSFLEEGSSLEPSSDSPFEERKSPSWLFCLSSLALLAIAAASSRRRKSLDLPAPLMEVYVESGPSSPPKGMQKEKIASVRAKVFLSKESSAPSLPPEALLGNEEERRNIAEVLSILDENDMFSIVSQRSRLGELEQELASVHPLTFLLVIFSDPKLKGIINRVFNDFTKTVHQIGFLKGVEKGLGSREIAELDPYLDFCAELLNTTKGQIRSFILQKDWRGLVLHLLQV